MKKCIWAVVILGLFACNQESSAPRKPLPPASPEADQQTAALQQASNDLITVAQLNDLTKIEDALRRGADVNFISQNAGSRIKVTDYSIETGPNGEGIFRYSGEELNKPWTALMWACDRGNTDAVKILLSKGANPEIKALDNGDTALIIATKKDNTEIVKLLLGNHAAVNTQNQEGFSPLALAAEGNNMEAVKLLLAKGADVNNLNAWQETPLMIASAYGLTDMVKLLLDNGAKINLQSEDGVTALLLATARNKKEIVKLLLEHKADVHLANVAGYTPLRVATEDNNTEIVKLLKAAGAKK
ncbi:MAG: ankyrin repeat domain-containing protein [Elusimicrobiaceae bacterium]|nr:ankyrin repeat domain-containing protein [Elusimicrobiaceae bacterium]